MKKRILVLGILTVSVAKAQVTNFYTNVTNLWFHGYKTNVLAMGLQRLNVNSNDLPGLLIQLNYDIAFTQLESLSNSLNRVLVVGETVTNENFKTCYPFLKLCNEHMLEFLSTYHPTPTELTEEQAKGLIPNKPFLRVKELEALQKDGLCEPLDP